MTIYQLKTKFQNLLRPLVKCIFQMGLTPNMITGFTCLLSLLIAALIYFLKEPKYFLIIPIFMFIRMALNAIDGMLAKEHNMITKFGGLLNEATDVLSDSALYLCFIVVPEINPIYLYLIIYFAFFTEFMGVSAVTIGKERRYDGPMGKSDRAFIFGLLGLLIFLGVNQYCNIILMIIVVLCLITTINRGYKALNS